MREPKYESQITDSAINSGFMPERDAPLTTQSHDLVARGFVDKFGLHPGIGLLIAVVDAMLFGGDLATAGFLIPLSIAVAFGLGIITFLAQRKWYGDDVESAFIKAFIVAGLSAIPTSLPGFLCIPAGVLGAFRKGEN